MHKLTGMDAFVWALNNKAELRSAAGRLDLSDPEDVLRAGKVPTQEFWIEVSGYVADAHGRYSCSCGEVTGEECAWAGKKRDTVRVRFLEEWQRETYRAAECGGTLRPRDTIGQVLRVAKDCVADLLGDWCVLEDPLDILRN